MADAANRPIPPSHEFNARAYAVNGELLRPVERKIEKQLPVELTGRLAAQFTRAVEEYNVEELVSFKRGHTRVAGSRSPKHQSWVTTATGILEGLNVLDVITAQRLVAQVSSNHSVDKGHFPEITFLGTEFTNIRVSGFELDLTLDFEICGKKTEGDISCLDNEKFLGKILKQAAEIAGADDLPNDVRKEYADRRDRIQELANTCSERKEGTTKPSVICSLVTQIGKVPIPGVVSRGHVLFIPDFGTVALGEVEISETMYPGSERPDNYYELTIARMNMGCIGHGMMEGPAGGVNGSHHP